MATIINHPGWDEDPWEIELHEAPVIDRDNYLYSDESPDKIADETPMRNDFGWGLVEGIANLFETIASGVGAALSGVGNFVGGAFEAVFTGVGNFIDGIAKAIRSIFGGSSGGSGPETPPQIFNPIKTNLEAVLKPRFDEIDELHESLEGLFGEIQEQGEEFGRKLEEQEGLGQSISDRVTELNNQLYGEPGAEGPDQGEINRINNVLWNEQTGWNVTQEKINEAQEQINTLQDQVNEEQRRYSELNRKMLEEQQEFISRTMIVYGRSGGARDDYMNVTRDGTGTWWRIEALGDWTGFYTYQSARYNSGSESWEPVIESSPVPDPFFPNPRVAPRPDWNQNALITYWVSQAKHEYSDATANNFWPSQTSWRVPSELTFTATYTGKHAIFWEFTWGAATYHDTYEARVRRNGSSTLLQWGPATKVGPIGFWGNGVQTRTLRGEDIHLNKGDRITFEVRSNADTTTQREIIRSNRRIDWMVEQTDDKA